MELRAINYSEYEGEPNEWIIKDLTFGPINLLVGKNASGKSRTLNAIKGLSQLLCKDSTLKYSDGNYHVKFKDQHNSLQYDLKFREYKILSEVFKFNGIDKLKRGPGGKGEIFTEKINDFMEFHSPENRVAVVARRDSIQHSFFDPLGEWGDSVYYYPFGSNMGRDSLALLLEEERVDFDPKQWERVIGIYRKGENAFGSDFVISIVRDMEELGYPIETVGLKTPTSIVPVGPLPGALLGLYVKERDLSAVTEQTVMSSGMFRALSIIIQLNYSQMALRPSCILIDDIGEGLDFERSKALIELLVRKATQSSVQLIMATNDRFVMNSVSLEAWTVIYRDGGKCVFFNYENSKRIFDEFKLTGMSNFDFFAVDFLRESKTNNG